MDLQALKYDETLPITAHRDEIIGALGRHQVIVVAGETGSGKTTQLPKFCLEAGRGAGGMIGCTQPRRIAARAMADRVSEELGTRLGALVGYQVRFRAKVGEQTRVKFMTDGILLAEITHDRNLAAYDTIIVDEAHERSLNIDFLLGYLKRLLPRRPDLKLVITSATIDTEKFSRHFGDAPVIEVSGRGYPVEVIYRETGEPDAEGERKDRDMYRGIAEAVSLLSRKDPRGDILVFLSGEREIHEAGDYLAQKGLRHTEILPLYARLSAAEQRRVFHPGPERRIILSTNVAETSLTVPRIRFVIDTGFARISRYAHRSRIQRLPIEPVSQASANQRMGRCGRLGPGVCVRLYSEEDFDLRPEFTEPEILRTSLASVILRMLTMGLGAVEEFPFLDPPAPRMIADAYHLLFELGAVDEDRQPTADGRRMARWPLDVRLARMVLEGSRQSCLEDLLVLAAYLSIQDPRERPLDAQQAADEAHERFADPKSDFAARLRLWAHLRKERRAKTGNQFRKLCRREFLNWQRVLEWFDLYQQLRDQAREERMGLHGGHGSYEQVHKALLSGLLSHVGQKHPEQPFYTGARNRHFNIFPGSGLFGGSPKWLMTAEIVETTKPYARTNAVIQPEWIEAQAKHLLKYSYGDPHWSRRRGQVVASQQVSMFGLVLAERRLVSYSDVDPRAARAIFILEALVRGDLDTRRGFLEHNRQMREEVERLEHKRRRRDVLVDEKVLSRHFDALLPDNVLSARTLEKWLARIGVEGRKQMLLSADLLTREDAGLAPPDAYPDCLQQEGHAFPLDYRFAPGAPDDGVTVTVTLELLNTLDGGSLQWLVPGMLPEKVTEIIRNLPKPVRRGLPPAPQLAESAMAELPAEHSLPLHEALAGVLSRLTGIALAPAALAECPIPEHLEIRIVLLGSGGKVLAVSRDLEDLQARYGQKARRRFMDRVGGEWNRDAETEWAFGDLPVSVKSADGRRAYPALVDQQDAVGLRLFDTAEDAAWSHLQGVRRLLAIGMKDKLRYLEKHHGIASRALMAWNAVGSSTDLVRDLAWSSLCAVADHEAAAVRGEASFRDLLGRARSAVGAEFQRRAVRLREVLEKFGSIRKALDAGMAERRPGVFQDIGSQLADLVYEGFLLDLEPGRLEHYPRYLEAIIQRLERLEQDPARDESLMAQVEGYWSRYLEQVGQGVEYGEALDRFRWLLEEYRVSLFAQQLKTAEKTSPKRLDDAWRQVMNAD
jgi:ATP-dependent helicase HrpA